MSELITGQKRTKRCAEFTEADVGSKVTAMGWVDTRRDMGKIIFVDLRDRSGIIQVVIDDRVSAEDFEKASKIHNEYVISVEGTLQKREESKINAKIPTGTIEIVATSVRILSECDTLPFQIGEADQVADATRLKYRYLDLRSAFMQRNLKLKILN